MSQRTHAGGRCDRRFLLSCTSCLLNILPQFPASAGSDYCFQSTEQLQSMSEDSSLLFLFKSGFQSWLVFAQKYVIADFLLINPSRVQAARRTYYYYLFAWGANVGCVLLVTGWITCSLPGSLYGQQLQLGKKHSLHVSNNACFSSPLDKQNLTGFFIKNSHLPFPRFLG